MVHRRPRTTKSSLRTPLTRGPTTPTCTATVAAAAEVAATPPAEGATSPPSSPLPLSTPLLTSAHCCPANTHLLTTGGTGVFIFIFQHRAQWQLLHFIIKRLVFFCFMCRYSRSVENKQRSKRQAPAPNGATQLCPTTSAYIMPRAALNNKGNWMYVVNLNEVDDKYTQLVRSESCA
jgi:hypothetical protein